MYGQPCSYFKSWGHISNHVIITKVGDRIKNYVVITSVGDCIKTCVVITRRGPCQVIIRGVSS